MGVITLNSEEIIKLGTSALNAIHDEQAESDLAKLIEIKDSIDNFLDTKAIDDYVENSGVLPEYIEEKNRPTTLTIKKI